MTIMRLESAQIMDVMACYSAPLTSFFLMLLNIEDETEMKLKFYNFIIKVVPVYYRFYFNSSMILLNNII